MSTLSPQDKPARRVKPQAGAARKRRGGQEVASPGAPSEETFRELEEWIAAGRLPELNPTRQSRSLYTALALVEAGRTLLLDHCLEDLAVETVCQQAGTTVGAFYGRFENKHAFFVTIQRLQTMRSESVVAEFSRRHAAGRSSLDELCTDIVSLTVQNFRTNFGVLKASLQHTQEGMWDLFKASGDRFRSALATRLAPHLTHLPPAQRKMRVLFSYQVIAGTLVHAVLNNPGPLKLEDEALITELVRLMKVYLEAPA